MIYQVRANFFFDIKDEADDFYHDCEMAFPKTSSVNPDGLNPEYSIAEKIQNHHDEDPNSACLVISKLSNEPPPPE